MHRHKVTAITRKDLKHIRFSREKHLNVSPVAMETIGVVRVELPWSELQCVGWSWQGQPQSVTGGGLYHQRGTRSGKHPGRGCGPGDTPLPPNTPSPLGPEAAGHSSYDLMLFPPRSHRPKGKKGNRKEILRRAINKGRLCSQFLGVSNRSDARDFYEAGVALRCSGEISEEF